jgi:hypothetical protein
LKADEEDEFSNNWAKLSYKRGRSAQDKIETKIKHSKESEHWLNQSSTSNRYTALLATKPHMVTGLSTTKI